MDSHKNNLEIILAQWQTCVEMANSVSQRRDTTNNVFITINLAIVAAFSHRKHCMVDKCSHIIAGMDCKDCRQYPLRHYREPLPHLVASSSGLYATTLRNSKEPHPLEQRGF